MVYRRHVGIIGMGRAGRALGAALAAAGGHVATVHARSSPRADRAAVAAAADIVLLAVPDDALAGLAAELAADLGDLADRAVGPAADRPVVAHLSGRHGLAALAPLSDRGRPRAAIHPIMTLAGTDRDAELLRGASFGITADPAAEGPARELVAAVGGRPVAVPEESRAVYHAALTLSANFGATLAAAAVELLATAGVADPSAAIGPLLHASLAGVLAGGDAAMTGPVRRGDAGTVQAHLAALTAAEGSAGGSAGAGGPSDPVTAAYRAVGRLTADRLARAGLVDAAALGEVVAALADPVADGPLGRAGSGNGRPAAGR